MYLADSRGAPAAVEHRGRRWAAVPGTVLALGAVSLITDVSAEMVTAVLPLYLVSGLGLSPLGFGVLDGVYNGVGALVRLAGGHLADGGGGRHKAVAVAGYGLSALCKPLLLFAHTLPVIGAVLALDRTGKGLRTAPRDALISLATPPERRGRAFGVHRAMDTTGALCGPVLAFLVLGVAAEGYDAVFTVSSCVAVLGVVVLVLFVPGRPARADANVSAAAGIEADVNANINAADTAAHTTSAADAADARGTAASSGPLRVTALLRMPGVRRLAACAVLLGLTTVSDSFVYLLLQRRFEVPAQWFPLLPLGTAAAFLLLAVPAGVVADRIGRRRLFLLGHLALLGAYGLVLAAPGGPLPAVAVLVLHGAFYAATDGVLAAAVTGLVPEALRARGLALVGTGQALARFACSIAFGAAWTAWGDGPALAVAAAGLAISTPAAIAALRPSAGPSVDPSAGPSGDPSAGSSASPSRQRAT
ncbi:MFS transporter [Microbispora triticiradicis]|uniref:MFS transporter n=2 Tax=Microbispora TaxID=2005 RepID=A0ABY3M4F9_9ACTN|nr:MULTISPECIES: MFS transporter [Microbispora]TLP56960.1 MFS transporter [Microbispora fusca]TYB66915.1 MFS transporter [Microbispora tritici]